MNVDQEPAQDSGHAPARGEMSGMDYGMRVFSYLVAGVLFYGGLGWLGDHYLGTSFLLPIGIVLGAAGGCYVIIRRYGRVPEETGVTLTPRLTRSGRRAPSYWTTNSKKEEAR